MKKICGTVICHFAFSKSLRDTHRHVHREVGATRSDDWDLSQQPTSLGYLTHLGGLDHVPICDVILQSDFLFSVEKGFCDGVFLAKDDDVILCQTCPYKDQSFIHSHSFYYIA